MHVRAGFDELARVREHRPPGSGCRIGDREVLVGGGVGRLLRFELEALLATPRLS